MFAELDAIQWNELNHAGGAATDVPDLLRALTSTDREIRDAALHELFGNLWHQGTVYPATAHAVPFLIEIANETTLADRANALFLLGSIAESTDGPRSAHDEVARHTDVLRELLEDGDSTVRAAAAHVLGHLVEHAVAIAPAIRARIEREPDALARAGMLLALVPLGDVSDVAVTWLERRFASLDDERERFAAAVALAHAAGATTPAAAIDVLAMACTDPEANEKRFTGLYWDVNGSYLPRQALVAAGEAAYRALPILLDALLATDDRVTASFLLED
ncbi:MAG TPA: HEAT repeat domain-containing protein, partial [Terriglobales bacterium]|nr:HEAT repeat domain-containing protein [Terriglobales bacterium]